jgi:hypothetical protein
MKNLILSAVLAILFNLSATAQCSCYSVHNVAVVGADSMELVIKNACDNNVYLNLYVISTSTPFDTLGRQEMFAAYFMPFDSAISNILSTSLTMTPALGAYRVSISNGGFGCDSLAFATTMSVSDIPQQQSLKIYPNPFSESATVVLDASLGEQDVLIFNSLGQPVRQLKSRGASMITIERDGLAAGMYFVRVMRGASVVANGALVLMD